MRGVVLVLLVVACGPSGKDCDKARAKAQAEWVKVMESERDLVDSTGEAMKVPLAEAERASQAAMKAMEMSNDLHCGYAATVARNTTPASPDASEKVESSARRAVTAARALADSPYTDDAAKSDLRARADAVEKLISAFHDVAPTIVAGKKYPPKVVAVANQMTDVWCDMFIKHADRIEAATKEAMESAYKDGMAKADRLLDEQSAHGELVKAAGDAATRVGVEDSPSAIEMPKQFAGPEPRYAAAQKATKTAMESCR